MSKIGRRLPALGLAAAALTLSAALFAAPASAAGAIPPGGVEVSDAGLDWTGNPEMQKAPPFGGSNYFSAGVSAGNEATYSAVAGDVAVYQVSAEGEETLASYATRAAHVGDGGKQLVRLSGGSGRIEADGSAQIQWQGSFSVNFYGGLVPFTIGDPALTVDADGEGELTGDLQGCSSSIDEPNVCTPLAPVEDAKVATFSGAEVDPTAPLTIQPDYAGVEVTVPEGATPQDRETAGWGAWPQEFVDFQQATGLSSYWYTSGGADADKPPLPFVVVFNGAETPAGTDDGDSQQPAGSTDGGGQPGPAPAPISADSQRPGLTSLHGARRPNGKGFASLASLSCPAGGGACKVAAPKHVRVKIGGRSYWLAVLAPKSIAAGRSVALRVRLPKGALVALRGHSVHVIVPLAIRSAGGKKTGRAAALLAAG